MVARSRRREHAGAKAHWEEVYAAKSEMEVSWYQEEPAVSITLIREAAPGPPARIIDVGGGASVLVDRLLDRGYRRLTVLDISATALERAKARLGDSESRVHWLVADITRADRIGAYDVWHDRAVFHFLTSPDDRRSYLATAERSLRSGGHLILATFAPEGPDRCSGLPVCRYDARSLSETAGSSFELIRTVKETHRTPWGASQAFLYCLFRRRGDGADRAVSP